MYTCANTTVTVTVIVAVAVTVTVTVVIFQAGLVSVVIMMCSLWCCSGERMILFTSSCHQTWS